MKRAIGVAAAVLLALLAVVQLGSDGLFGSAGVAGSLPRAVPRGAGTRIYGVLGALPFPSFLRRTAAQAALDDRDVSRAQALVDELRPGPERDDLQGRIFEAQGDHARAVARFVAAGDLVRVGDSVDALDREGRTLAALSVARALVAELERLHQIDGRAHAYWRLAQLEAKTGDHRDALASYARALVLEPLSETYLLGAANEAMGNGEPAAALATFARVVELDPGSVDGHVGIGRADVRLGNLAGARRQAAIVARLAPGYHDLPLLEGEIERAGTGAR